MERKLEALHQQASTLGQMLPGVSFGRERIRNASASRDFVLGRTLDALQDFPSSAESGLYGFGTLGGMLADICLEAASILFAAGAPDAVWRAWCGLSGDLHGLAGNPAYAMQLLTIARIPADDSRLSPLGTAPLKSHRHRVIQYVVFRPSGAQPPRPPKKLSPSDAEYQAILRELLDGDPAGLSTSIAAVVQGWLDEVSYEEYEPGGFPVFEPEINALVSALVMQGVELEFRDDRVVDFLQASLD
jgi:hypothetical protein